MGRFPQISTMCNIEKSKVKSFNLEKNKKSQFSICAKGHKKRLGVTSHSQTFLTLTGNFCIISDVTLLHFMSVIPQYLI